MHAILDNAARILGHYGEGTALRKCCPKLETTMEPTKTPAEMVTNVLVQIDPQVFIFVILKARFHDFQ
jgi:hypothetical protein